jgi:hypothetical protein
MKIPDQNDVYNELLRLKKDFPLIKIGMEYNKERSRFEYVAVLYFLERNLYRAIAIFITTLQLDDEYYMNKLLKSVYTKTKAKFDKELQHNTV